MHTVVNLGIQLFVHDRGLVDDALGFDNINLFRALLEANIRSGEALMARLKAL